MSGYADLVSCCRAPHCSSIDWARAHIVPACFARRLSSIRGRNIHLTATGGQRARQQNGETDDNILCRACDAVIGQLDQYGLEVCQRFPTGPYNERFAELNVVDGDRFALFVLSIIWRASISNRENFACIDLGRYEALAAKALFEGFPMADFSEYSLIANRFWSDHLDAAKFYTLPVRDNIRGINIVKFALGGFQLIAKFDRRPFSGDFATLAANGKSVLRCAVIPLENTSEFSMMLESAIR